jgi:hypothetical protein
MTTPEQIESHRAETLATLSDEHPVWCALQGILIEARDSATQSATQSDLDAEPRAWQCCYLAAIIDLRDELRRLREQGQQADS